MFKRTKAITKLRDINHQDFCLPITSTLELENKLRIRTKLNNLVLPFYGIIFAIINLCIYFAFLLANYPSIELFLNLAFFLVNNQIFFSKTDKYKAIVLFYLGSLFTFPGITIVSLNVNYLIIYLFSICFLMFSLTLNKRKYLPHASICITFATMQIDTTITAGSLHEAFNLFMALNIGFSLIFVMTALYPERYQEQSSLAIDNCLLYLIKTMKSSSIEDFNYFVEKIGDSLSKLEDLYQKQEIETLDKLAKNFRQALLTTIYLKRRDLNDKCFDNFGEFLTLDEIQLENNFNSDKLYQDAKNNLNKQLLQLKKILAEKNV